MEMTPDALGQARQQCAEHVEQLRAAAVTASSTKGVVNIVCDGFGDFAKLQINPGAKQRYEHDSMASFITSAFTAADQAVEALQQHAFASIGDIEATAEPGATNRQIAASTVASCFGEGSAVGSAHTYRARVAR